MQKGMFPHGSPFLHIGCILLLINQIHSQFLDTSDEVCPVSPRGDDDLPAFDFISKYELDSRRNIPGVLRVKGSSEPQVAYRISRKAKLRIPTALLFPRGLPEQFSFVSTIMMSGATRKAIWNLIKIVDPSGRIQMGIRLNGKKRTVDFYYKNKNNQLSTLTFTKAKKLFSKAWHKIHFSVGREYIEMYLDCKPVESIAVTQPRANIDTEGEIVLGTDELNGTTVPFELQWMVLHCDYQKPERETCDEIPKVN